MPIPWLNLDAVNFPPVSSALDEPDGLLAAGGDLSPARLVNAYRHGIFPWYQQDQPLLWWSPNPRMVLYLDRLHTSRSLVKHIRKKPYSITLDQCFSRVMTACAEDRRDHDGTWITPAMAAAYAQLHKLNIAHSVEVWQGMNLVGGLYGLSIGQVFFGESMFSRKSDASKIALVFLVRQLLNWRYRLIDCQVSSKHLLSLGAEEISRQRFCSELEGFIDLPGKSGKWQMEIDLE